MKVSLVPALGVACLAPLLFACGPGVSSGDGTGDDEVTVDAGDCVPLAEDCANTQDDDCDGYFDCADVDCYGVGTCPSSQCGELDLTEGQPLALPDGTTGVPTAACGGVTATGQYTSAINFTGFSTGQTLAAGDDILGICVVMEHSFLHDLQIEMTCPDGQLVVLDQFRGVGSGGPLFMGVPDDSDYDDPNPGTGWEYCWRPTATQQMLDWGSSGTLPAGDYVPSCPLTAFEGCTLNGDWTIKVTDLWGADNGFIFSWGIEFDPSIVEDCDDWPVD